MSNLQLGDLYIKQEQLSLEKSAMPFISQSKSHLNGGCDGPCHSGAEDLVNCPVGKPNAALKHCVRAG